MFLRWRGSPRWGWETTYYSAAGGEKRLKTRMAMKGFCGTRWRRALRHHSRGFTWDLPTERSDSRLSSVRGEIAFCALLFLTLDVVVAQCHLFQHSCLLATQRCLPAGADGWKPITHLVKTGSMIGSNLLSEGGGGTRPDLLVPGVYRGIRPARAWSELGHDWLIKTGYRATGGWRMEDGGGGDGGGNTCRNQKSRASCAAGESWWTRCFKLARWISSQKQTTGSEM